MGIKTVMITGDNPLTATAISGGSREWTISGSTPRPEAKLKLIRDYQTGGAWWP